MTESSTLEERLNGIAERPALWFAGLFMVGWAVMLVGDWHQRFARYEWDRQIVSRPARTTAPAADVDPARPAERPLFRTNQVAASRGGDLTALIGVRSFVARFEEERPARIDVVDPDGFVNHPHDLDRAPDVVVVGDSFMATGGLEHQFSTRLAEETGLFVYNRAMFGHGPFVSVLDFLSAPRFQDQWPSVLVWGFAEREVGGDFFESFAARLRWLERRAEIDAAGETPERRTATPQRKIYWGALKPHRLRTSLPDTSFTAQTGQWLWNRARYHLFRQIHPWVVEAAEPVAGGPMLFYQYHIETLGWDEEIRGAGRVAQSIAELDAFCRARDMKLVVLLIPEKEQVYRNAIPPRFNPAESPLPASPLWEVESELQARGVPVVNLLAPFREATAAGTQIYWRDDTHWNYTGIGLAARLVAQELEP